MSSDFINPIGAKTPRLQTNQVAPQRAVETTPKTETQNQAATQAPAADFKPTSEARESLSDVKAGEAKASEILGAWSSQPSGPAVSAGNLAVQGESNTSVNQVHGVKNGVYEASNAAKPGFTEATVYSNRPPQG